jgi:CheY-like chemotaxis protein
MGTDEQHQRGLRILVVDDNNDSALSKSMLVELKGCRTDAADNGPEAVREATRVRYVAVLVDRGLLPSGAHLTRASRCTCANPLPSRC